MLLKGEKMKRILVIGSPGAGKSTFSRKLHNKFDLPLFYLDNLFWKADKTTIPPKMLNKQIKSILKQPQWIIDGNYSQYLLDERLDACNTVFFLDYDVETCLQGVRDRIGKKRPDLPWIEQEEDPEFMEYIRQFPLTKRPQIIETLSKHPQINQYQFKNRKYASDFLNQYKE